MKRRLLLLTAFCLVATRAQAREASAKSAPAALLKLLPNKAISLRWQQVSSRPPVWAHLWCVPRGHSKEREQMTGEKRSGPVRRQDIDNWPSVEPSPFTLDVFEVEEENPVGWKKLSRAVFTQSSDVQEIHTRFLDPRTRLHPVLLLHFGFTHWHDWEVFTLARGWGSPIAHQTFGWGGEGESHVFQRFDRVHRGRLVIDERAERDGQAERGTYFWNGREWDDPSQKWLVIGAWGNRSAMQTLAARRGWGQARPASEFPRLRSKGWVWLIARYRREPEAREHLQMLRKEKIDARVRRAR